MTGQTRLASKDEPIVYVALPLVAVPHEPERPRHFRVTPPSFSRTSPRRDTFWRIQPTFHIQTPTWSSSAGRSTPRSTISFSRHDTLYTIWRCLAKKYSHNGCSFPICLDFRAPSPKLRLIIRQFRRPPTAAEARRTPLPTFRLWKPCCIQWNDSQKN